MYVVNVNTYYSAFCVTWHCRW